MTVNPYILNLPWEGLRRLAGPVLDKELRVLSRRKRTYWMRSLYPVLLVLIVVGSWTSVRLAGKGGQMSLALSGMDQLARSVVSAMVWLQFMLCQFMAIVLVSSSMSEEVRRRSLSALMTTPIRSGQILLGKLLGPLMMVWTLLALSCPLLALIRVWGGIPWDYLVSTLAVTACVTLCLGAISLFLSLWVERPYKVILLLLSLMIIGYISGFLPLQLHQLSLAKFLWINPWAVFTALSMGFSQAGAAVKTPWQAHCLLLLGIAVGSFIASMLCLRSRALADPQSRRRGMPMARRMKGLMLRGRTRSDQTIQTLTGAPLLWKELGCSPRRYVIRQSPWALLLAAILLACMAVPSLLGGGSGLAGQGMIYTLVTSGISLLVTLRTATMAAWCVAHEKEARSWGVLLCTPLPDIWILRHKALAVILKNIAGWAALLLGSLGYLVYFVFQGGFGEFGMGLYVLSSFLGTFASLYMVTGTGLYFSIRMRSAALALVTTLGFLIFVHMGIRFLMFPLVFALGSLISRAPFVFTFIYPLVSVVVGAVMFKLCGKALRKYVF